MNTELTPYPAKFLDFPLHRILDSHGIARIPKRMAELMEVGETHSDTGVSILNKVILWKALQILSPYGIDQYTSIGNFFVFIGKKKVKERFMMPVTEACEYIHSQIKKEVDRLRPGVLDERYVLIQKGWDLEILNDSQKIPERTLGGPKLWEAHGDKLRAFYSQHGDPKNIKARIKLLQTQLKGGGGNIHYRGAWREAKWESQLSELRILEFTYLLENGLLNEENEPQEC